MCSPHEVPLIYSPLYILLEWLLAVVMCCKGSIMEDAVCTTVITPTSTGVEAFSPLKNRPGDLILHLLLTISYLCPWRPQLG